MNNYHFDLQTDMRGTGCCKWDKAGAQYPFPFSVADTDFRPPVEIEEAIIQKVRQGNLAYGIYPPAFHKAIKSWYERRYGTILASKWIRNSPGLIVSTKLIMEAVTRVGENVLVMPPVYFNFREIVEKNGRNLVESPLIFAQGHYRIDFEDLERKARDPRTTMLILCNPHNPIGHCWPKEELAQIAEICSRHGVFVLSDEAHADIVYNGAKHTVFLDSCEAAKDNCACINAPGKAFNINGLYVSYAIIPNEHIRIAYDNAYENHHFDFSLLGAEALIAAYEYGARYVDELNEYIEGNIRYLDEFLKTNLPKIRMVPPNATYLAWLDFRDCGMNSQEADLFLKSAGLVLNRGDLYGAHGDGFMRFNVACSRTVLEQALKALKNHPSYL